MIFLFATELEAQQFRAECPHATVEICGVGAAACAASTALIIERLKARGRASETLVLCGIAGSYSLSDVALCEVVEVVQEQILALPERFRVCYSVEPQTALRSVSSNSVNSSAEGLCPTQISSGTTPNPQIENMEGAAFMAICQGLGVSHLHIRSISNRVGDPLAEWRISEACHTLAEALCRLYDACAIEQNQE